MSIKNEQAYDLIANEFASSRDKSDVTDYVRKFGNLFTPGDHILDIGCGSGIPNAKFLAGLGLQITGIDISSKLLAFSKINVPTGNFHKIDIAKYHSYDKFNGIIAWDSLFHLDKYEHKPIFRKISSLLLDNGYFLFTHGGSSGSISSDMYGQRFTYSSPGPKKLKEILESLEFEIVEWELDTTEKNGYVIALVKR